MYHLRLLPWSRWAYVLGLVLSLIFMIPGTWLPLQLGKLAFFAVFLCVSALLFAASGGVGRFFMSGGARSALLIVVLPLAYLVSLLFSVDRAVGVVGYGLEGDTILFVVLCAVAFLLSFSLFKSPRSARALVLCVFSCGIIAAAFQLLVLALGPAFFSQVFSDRTVNLVGKWNDLGVLAGLALFFLLAWLEFGALSLRRRALAGVASAALLFLLAVIQFPLVWWLVLASSLFLAAWSFITQPEESRAAVPWIPLAGAALAALFLLWGAALSGGIARAVPAASLEVRPALSSTLAIVRASHSDALQFLFGTGPDTFGQEWLLHKPAGVNQSPFWNLNFDSGFSVFLTALGSVGVAGALAWLIPLALVLLGGMRAVRALSGREKVAALLLCAAALYVWSAVLFYVPSQNMLLLAFVLAGAAFGLSYKDAPAARPRFAALLNTRARQAGAGAAALVFIVIVVWAGGATLRRLASEALVNQGSNALARGDIDGALTLSARARHIETTGDDVRLGVDAAAMKLQQLSASSSPSRALQAQFASVAQQGIALGQQAIALDPQDYRPYLSVGNIYALLASLKVDGAYQTAAQAYQAAAARSPGDPQIPLLLARLASASGDTKGTQAYLSQALTLKPDYTDVILFVVELDVANKDLQSAVVAAQAAVESAPGVPVVWFELGLLYYTDNDSAHAIPALVQALALEPDYANARYFLGLAYAAAGKTQDALAQFKTLAKSNPDNAQVKLILSNLLAGKPPLPAEASIPAAPREGTGAPVSQ